MKPDETKTHSKPVILAIKDAESKLVKTVNEIVQNDKIPCYFLEMILDKIHCQIKNIAEKELAQVSARYISEKNAEQEKKGADPE